MAKITLSDVQSGFGLPAAINDRLQQVEDELNNKVLYRDNPVGESNQMENDIDLNSNDILNVSNLSTDVLYLGGVVVSPEALSENAIATVPTVASLRSLEPTSSGQSATTVGHTQPGVGSLQYYADLSDTTTPDNNGTVIVTNGGRRWKAVLLGYVTPEMFGARGDDPSFDDSIGINAALLASRHVKGYGKTYHATRIEMVSNSLLEFPGKHLATIKSIAGSNTSTVDDRQNGASNWTLRGVTVDGDVENRGAGSSNNIFIDNGGATLEDVRSTRAPNAGILADGADVVTYLDVETDSNTGVGVSHSSVDRLNGTLLRCRDNGLENITIDGNSNTVNIDNLILGQHRGGCGNIGIDCTGDINIGNLQLDSGESLVPNPGNRNGVCVNAESHQTRRINIVSGIIRGCPDSGILLRDRSGTGGYIAGDMSLGAIQFAGNGEDITVQETDRTVAVAATCQLSSISTADSSTDDVRLAAGHVVFDRRLPSPQSVPADGGWHEVQFTGREKDRLTDQSGNGVALPVGSVYHLASKIRFEGLSATSSSSVALRITMGSLSKIINLNTDNKNTLELLLSDIFYSPKGVAKVEVRALGGSGTFTIAGGSDSTFTGTNLG